MRAKKAHFLTEELRKDLYCNPSISRELSAEAVREVQKHMVTQEEAVVRRGDLPLARQGIFLYTVTVCRWAFHISTDQ